MPFLVFINDVQNNKFQKDLKVEYYHPRVTAETTYQDVIFIKLPHQLASEQHMCTIAMPVSTIDTGQRVDPCGTFCQLIHKPQKDEKLKRKAKKGKSTLVQ